jgi:predicted GIY-YIG superfamily endonuclease
MHWAYVLACADGALYVEETADLIARERTHNESGGSMIIPRRIVPGLERRDLGFGID